MLRVAIAEDDFRVAELHEKFLSKIDDVQFVGKSTSGKETLDLVKKVSIDLLLLDIYMPDMLGIELLGKVKTINPKIGVIMISAANEKMMVENALQQGIFDYIIKPVNIERFIAAIDRFKYGKYQLADQQEIEQSVLDHYFGYSINQPASTKSTPKGIDPLSLEKVKTILSRSPIGITAEEMGEKMGASRTTARRYLEYLISIGEGKAELEYGIVGRPERKYYLKHQVTS
jgi:two-component system, CitB family, response regulator CitT